jgi:(R,R)-butanediol dehydrogenase/meso-butanediol dehydrogenase/diacetyl reductase
MQAAVYYGKEDVRVKEWPEPLLEDREILVRVRYGGVCGSDMTIYSGKHPRAKAPLVPGHEVFGRIEAVGPALGNSWRKGTRVAIYPLICCGECVPCIEGNAHVCERLRLVGIDRDGGFAEFVKVEPHHLVPVPDDLSDEQAALIEPLSVAVHAVYESGFRTGDTVVITGGGPIGNLVAQVARASGAREVVVSEVKAFRRELAERMGFLTIAPNEANRPETLKRMIGQPSADIVFEATGSPDGYKDAVQLCKARGEICFVGIPKAPPEFDIQMIVFKEIRTTCARVYRMRDYYAAIKLLSRGAVDALPLITRVPLKDAPLGFKQMNEAESSLKILLVP